MDRSINQVVLQVTAALSIALAISACGKTASKAISVKSTPAPSNPSPATPDPFPTNSVGQLPPSAPVAPAPVTPLIPIPTLAPTLKPLEDGSYKTYLTWTSSFKPMAMLGFTINQGKVEAEFRFGPANNTRVHLSGTYAYRDEELVFLQESLTLTLAAGEGPALNCPDLGYQEEIPIDVAGKSCGQFQFAKNQTVVPTGFFLVNEATLTTCVKSGFFRFGNQCGLFDIQFSFVLQRQLARFLPTSAPANGVFSGGFLSNLIEFSNISDFGFQSDTKTITISGNSFTLVSDVYAAPNSVRTLLGVLTTAGTYLLESPTGFIRFVQSSMTFKPNASAEIYLSCSGTIFSDGVEADVAGKSCSQFDFHANGDVYGSSLTALDADTIVPCWEGYVNCQKDVTKSFLRKP